MFNLLYKLLRTPTQIKENVQERKNSIGMEKMDIKKYLLNRVRETVVTIDNACTLDTVNYEKHMEIHWAWGSVVIKALCY
jgi:hypothetical protein